MSGILKDLLPALQSKASGSATFSNAMGGRIFYEEGKTLTGVPLTIFPYAVFKVVSEVPTYTFASELSNVLIDWTIYDNISSPIGMMDYISKLHAVFDEVVLVVNNWTSVRVSRDGHRVFPRDEDGVRMSVSTYRILTQKN